MTFSSLTGAQEVPPVTITAFSYAGYAATTVDAAAGTLTVEVNSIGVADATAAEVDVAPTGAIGPRLIALTKDSVNMGHWANELAPITAADLANFNADHWYVNVATPAFPHGAIRGQVNVH